MGELQQKPPTIDEEGEPSAGLIGVVGCGPYYDIKTRLTCDNCWQTGFSYGGTDERTNGRMYIKYTFMYEST